MNSINVLFIIVQCHFTSFLMNLTLFRFKIYHFNLNQVCLKYFVLLDSAYATQLLIDFRKQQSQLCVTNDASIDTGQVDEHPSGHDSEAQESEGIF